MTSGKEELARQKVQQHMRYMGGRRAADAMIHLCVCIAIQFNSIQPT